MIYTASPLARSQTTSQAFADRGINGEAPAEISSSRISVIMSHTNSLFRSALTIMWAVAASFLLNLDIDLSKTVHIGSSTISSTLFSAPSLVVTFSGKDKEATANKMRDLDFTPQSSGKYNFYKGPASDNAAKIATEAGAHADAYSPYGTVNVNGYLAFKLIDRFLAGIIYALSRDPLTAEAMSKIMEDDSVSAPKTVDDIGLIKVARDINFQGFFFPYFHGLLLPDKSFVPNFIITNFHRMFGKTPADISRNCGILSDGWLSLSTSTAGVAISHLVFGISLAYGSGCRIKPAYLNNQYSGFFLIAEKGMAILKGKALERPYSQDALRAEFDELNVHESTLEKIAQILEDLELLNEVGVKKPCPSVSINTPRRLYNQIRIRRHHERTKEIASLVPKLQFTEKYWELSSMGRVAEAIDLISRAEFPQESVPFAYKTYALFSPNPIPAILAAFGPAAPSIIGSDTGNAIIQVTQNARMFEETKGFSLPGIPLFVKSLSQAAEDWDSVVRSGVIRFKQNGNDKFGVAKVAGRATFIPKGSDAYKSVVRSLIFTAEARGKKRQREEVAEDPVKEAEKADKRRRLGVEAMAVLEEGGIAMDTDDVEDF